MEENMSDRLNYKLKRLYIYYEQNLIATFDKEQNEHGNLYKFKYVDNPKHLIFSFPDKKDKTCSKELPPFFTNRLMPSNRPDYQDYMQGIGLDLNDNPDDFDILNASKGKKLTQPGYWMCYTEF